MGHMRGATRCRAHRSVELAAVGVLSGALACAGTTSPRTDPRACQQTYEFGNSGCAEIEGRVVDAADRPFAGVIVGPRYLDGMGGFNTVYATTDSDGQFRFRVTRFGAPNGVPGPDTLSLYVLAADPRSAGVNVPATVRDSALVRVTVAPVGTIPTPTTVVVRLTTTP